MRHRATPRGRPGVSRALGPGRVRPWAAIKIIGYRSEHGLTQTQLASEVGTTQSVIGRLELGEHPPSLATLAKLTASTGLEFHIDITGGEVAVSG